ncbi:dynamin family protein [Paraburkholderia tropica]|uniref:dynamin family protein n=1 Tax=Paraburkholderia tropica TaxID=92647 RepID=UPI002AB091E2|nr:dynamin family protein [Paraburkholderia tropica]
MSNEQALIAAIDACEIGLRDEGDNLRALDAWRDDLLGCIASHRFSTSGLRYDCVLARVAHVIDAALHDHAHACGQASASLEAAQSFADRFDAKVMLLVFGKFNAGKSAFCNFIAARFMAHEKTARYFHVEAGRIVETSNVLEEGATETTARLQGVCLGDQLVLIDTPGLHSVVPENAALTQCFIESADGVIWLTSSTSPGQVQELDDLSRELHRNKPLLPVVTRSDEYEEDEIDGELVRQLCNKSDARRELQEADVRTRAKRKLGEISVNTSSLMQPVSVSVHMAGAQGFTEQALNEAGFERLYAALGEIAEPALAYKQRKGAEMVLHHLEENVLDALYACVSPLIEQLRESAQQVVEQIEVRRAQLTGAVGKRIYAMLPDVLETHAAARDADGVVRTIASQIDDAFSDCVREYFSDYEDPGEHALGVFAFNSDAAFEDIVVETGSPQAYAKEVVGVDYLRLHGALKQAVDEYLRDRSRALANQARVTVNQLIEQTARLHEAITVLKAQLMNLKDQIRTQVA